MKFPLAVPGLIVAMILASVSAMAAAPSTKPAIPAKDQLGKAVALAESSIHVPAPKQWDAKANPTADAAYSFIGFGGRAMITVYVMPAGTSADATLADQTVKEAKEKPNHNPNMRVKVPATKDKDVRFLARWHELFTIRGVPSKAVHLYRLVGDRVLHVQIGSIGLGNAEFQNAVEIGEGMTLSASDSAEKK